MTAEGKAVDSSAIKMQIEPVESGALSKRPLKDEGLTEDQKEDREEEEEVRPDGWRLGKINFSSLLEIGPLGLKRIISKYATRKSKGMAYLDLLTKHGGTQGIMEKIKVNPSKGVANGDDVKMRRKFYGSNEQEKPKLRTVCEIVHDVLEDPMLRILLAASMITIIINEAVAEDYERPTGMNIFYYI